MVLGATYWRNESNSWKRKIGKNPHTAIDRGKYHLGYCNYFKHNMIYNDPSHNGFIKDRSLIPNLMTKGTETLEELELHVLQALMELSQCEFSKD